MMLQELMEQTRQEGVASLAGSLFIVGVSTRRFDASNEHSGNQRTIDVMNDQGGTQTLPDEYIMFLNSCLQFIPLPGKSYSKSNHA